MSQYSSISVLICTSRDAGNVLANLAASFPSDPGAELRTFDDSRMLSPQAWYAVMPSKATFAGVCRAITDDADYSDDRLSYLRERGVTAEQWALAKSIIRCQVIPRDQFTRQHLLDFIQAQGFEIMEPSE